MTHFVPIPSTPMYCRTCLHCCEWKIKIKRSAGLPMISFQRHDQSSQHSSSFLSVPQGAPTISPSPNVSVPLRLSKAAWGSSSLITSPRTSFQFSKVPWGILVVYTLICVASKTGNDCLFSCVHPLPLPDLSLHIGFFKQNSNPLEIATLDIIELSNEKILREFQS